MHTPSALCGNLMNTKVACSHQRGFGSREKQGQTHGQGGITIHICLHEEMAECSRVLIRSPC